MRAVQFFDSLQLSTNAAAGEPREGEVIVDVLQAGICETDLQLCRGYMGFQGTLGHEFVGIARSGQFKGRRVVAEINCACRNCDFCQRGQQNHCPNRTVIGILDHPGAFADSLIVPEVNLHAIPDCVDNDEAVFVEPLAAGCRIPQQLPEIADKAVTIIGDGRLGNLCAQVLKHHRCDVTVVGKHDFKLSILRQLGIRTVHLDQIGTLPRTQYVVDCTGSESGLSAALNLVSPTGVVVLKTTVAAEHSVQLAGIVIDELRIVGSRCGPFADAIKLLEAGSVDVKCLITDRYPIEDAMAAFDRAKQKDALKVILDIGRE